MKDETPLNVIIVEQDRQTVSRVEQVCRDAGYAVSAQHVTNPDELRDALRTRSWDLIVAGNRVTGISVSQVTATVREQKSDAPVVVIISPGDEASIGGVLDAGVRDAAVLNPTDRLVHVIKRETADLEDRRALKIYKGVLEQYEDRLLYFLDHAEKRQAQTPSGEPQASLDRDADNPVASAMEETMVADQTSEVIDTMANEMAAMALDSRSAFFDDLSKVLAEEPRRPGYQALLYIALKFAPAAALDAASTQAFLAAVEERLRGATATPTLISRYDGLSFVALISQGDRQGLARAAYSIKHVIEEVGIEVGDREVRALCKIGACLADQQVRQPTRLIASAKAACEKAATEGGKRICFSGKVAVAPEASPASVPESRAKAPASPVPVAEASTVSSAKEKSDPLSGARPAPVSVSATRVTAKDGWPARLRAALDENRFKLVFQPVVHFHAPPTETYEILLRMIDETGQEVMPGEF
ncbi:MAG: diguanylate cyclase, partial [Gammaproteobacteria bacterium]